MGLYDLLMQVYDFLTGFHKDLIDTYDHIYANKDLIDLALGFIVPNIINAVLVFLILAVLSFQRFFIKKNLGQLRNRLRRRYRHYDPDE